MKPEILKKQAQPGLSMFSYNLETKEIEFVATVFFTAKEAQKKTVKYYLIPKQEGKVYIQAFNSVHARQRMNAFLEKQKSNLNIQQNENQIESSKELQKP